MQRPLPDPNYQSDIPADAVAVIVERHPNGAPLKTELHRDGALVGRRLHELDGSVEGEWPVRDGLTHGRHYRFHENGHVNHEEPYEAGLIHGTSRQWDTRGRLLGTTTFERGTGLDLWWQPSWEDPDLIELTEVMPMVDGVPHGVQWWFSGGELTLELAWRHGARHGIEREWSTSGRLRRGYPHFWVQDRRVRRAAYLSAAAGDPSLPPWRAEDDAPTRLLPAEVGEAMLRLLTGDGA